jgi:hypothetical protein
MNNPSIQDEYEKYHPKIFISYSHDSKEHCEAILAFAQRLRSDGFDASIDRFVEGTPTQGWPRWMLNQVDNADFIILICTKTYYRRFRGFDDLGRGRGADYEGAIITNELYSRKSVSQRFIPAFVRLFDPDHVPEPLRQFTSYNLSTSYDELTKFLSGRSGVDPVDLGPAPLLRFKISKSGHLSDFSQALEGSIRKTSLASGRALTNYVAPGGAMAEDDQTYIERSSDKQSAAAAARRCETIVIKGPKQFGKSSLLKRYLLNCRTNGKQVIAINFLGYEEKVISDYSLFLTRLGADLSRRLKNEPLKSGFTEQFEFLDYLEDDLLNSIDKPVIFAFDETDKILPKEYAQDFFSMIRMWHNNRGDPSLVWNNVGIALVTCSEPKLFIKDPLRSPFNVGEKILLCPFQLEEVEKLNSLHGCPLSLSECKELHILLGGHPFLTREAFYKIAGPSSISFRDLIENSFDEDGPFGEHLRALILNIKMVEGLQQTLYEAINNQTATRLDNYYRLRGAGILSKKDGRVVFSTDLYLKFFGSYLRSQSC